MRNWEGGVREKTLPTKMMATGLQKRLGEISRKGSTNQVAIFCTALCLSPQPDTQQVLNLLCVNLETKETFAAYNSAW